MKERGFIKLRRWLLPASWLYGLAVALRNRLFDMGVLKERRFAIPTISVGNLTVGGTGKTPHVEHIVRLLTRQGGHDAQPCRVAILSRGYKRRTRGYLLAAQNPTPEMVGDEPCQMKLKFPEAHVAVCADRCEGIERLLADDATQDTDVVVLDDAMQHRHVRAGLRILLIDANRLPTDDALLPAGRLREPESGKKRAQVIIVTKCAEGMTPLDFRVLTKAVAPYPFQSLFFTTLRYGLLRPLGSMGQQQQGCMGQPQKGMGQQQQDGKGQPQGGKERPLASIRGQHVLLITGIASPEKLRLDLEPHGAASVTLMAFADHHAFTPRDLDKMGKAFGSLPEPRTAITTEKDEVRLLSLLAEGQTPTPDSSALCASLRVLPIRVEFLGGQEETFNEKIRDYVRHNTTHGKNQHDRRLAQAPHSGLDDDARRTLATDGHHTRLRPRTISFRGD